MYAKDDCQKQEKWKVFYSTFQDLILWIVYVCKFNWKIFQLQLLSSWRIWFLDSVLFKFRQKFSENDNKTNIFHFNSTFFCSSFEKNQCKIHSLVFLVRLNDDSEKVCRIFFRLKERKIKKIEEFQTISGLLIENDFNPKTFNFKKL